MAKSIEKAAKTVQQAINDALEELGVTEDDVVIEVVDEGESGGLLGIGRRSAVVRVSLADDQLPENDDFTNDEEAAAANPDDHVYYGDDEYSDEPESQAESETMDYVADILKGIGIHGRISSYYQDGNLHIDVSGHDCGAAIGRHGETLDAIQYLSSLVANKYTEEHTRVIVDIGGYRKRREQTLIGIAERTAQKVMRSGKQIRLEPMNPAERRIVHSALQGFPEVTTFSEGMDPDRCVIIAPARQD
jgi:spoIIIJ-associated protein